MIPEMTRLAWDTKKDEIIKQTPGITREKFRYNLNRRAYEKDWGAGYTKPGIFGRAVAYFLVVVPKVGPFRSLAFKPPTPETEKLFIASFRATVDSYKEMLGQVGSNQMNFADDDLDTGHATLAGEYGLADKAYGNLLHRLADKKFATVTPELRENILAFYGDGSSIPQTRQNQDERKKTMAELTELKAFKIQQTSGGTK